MTDKFPSTYPFISYYNLRFVWGCSCWIPLLDFVNFLYYIICNTKGIFSIFSVSANLSDPSGYVIDFIICHSLLK
jgi:hypothetical protein